MNMFRPALMTSVADELNIDLLAIHGGANARIGSLKECGIKNDYPYLRELPYQPDTILNPRQMAEVAAYNTHDLNITKITAEASRDQVLARLALAAEYGDKGLLNRHDAGVAVNVLAIKMFGLDHKPMWPTATSWQVYGAQFTERFSYRTPELEALRQRIAGWNMQLNLEINEGADGEQEKSITGGKFADACEINGVTYRIGQGGLHSDDQPGLWEADDRYRLIDFDIASFYPALIINHQLCPAHLPVSRFIEAFVDLRDRRLAAKRSGEKALADGLKIAINSVFGKTKSPYSWLCDPVMQLAVTITGQLSLLTFVDMLADCEGVEVVSVNTDGLCLRVMRDRAELVSEAMHAQAAAMKLELDTVEYRSVARRDINNYVALTLDGRIKGKGAYAYDKTNLGKKSINRVVIDAAQRRLAQDIPVENTVNECMDIRDFIDFFKATKQYQIVDDRGQSYGGIARWYLGTGGVHLDKRRVADGQLTQLVASGAVVVADLPSEMPLDVDRAAYIAQAEKLVAAILDPPQRVSWSVPLAELSRDQQQRQRYNLETRAVDRERVAEFDLTRVNRLYAETFKGNKYSSMKSLAVMVWCQGRGTLTQGDLLALLRAVDESDGYFATGRRRVLENMAEWVATEISPWPLPRTPEEHVARAMVWANENVEALKRQKKAPLTHKAVLKSDFVSKPMLRKYQAGGNMYALACAICAVGVKHGQPPSPDLVLRILADVERYVNETV